MPINMYSYAYYRLESAGEYDTAAGWALFNGLPDRAIKALSSQRGKTLGSSDGIYIDPNFEDV